MALENLTLTTLPNQVLLSEEQIQNRIAEMASQIREIYAGESILVVGVLKGSFLFLADLCRQLGPEVSVDFIQVSSYGDQKVSSGIVQIRKDIDQSIEGKNVLVVEDIVDTGATLAHLRELLLTRKPKTLRVVSLLNKPDARKVPVEIEFVGFDIPNAFVVGYGLDYAERYRNLPYIGVFESE